MNYGLGTRVGSRMPALVMLGVVAILVGGGSRTTDRGPACSPLSWTTIDPASQSARLSALELAGKLLGLELAELDREDVSVTSVRFEDKHPFGEASVEAAALHVVVPAVRIEIPATPHPAWVSMNLVIDSTGRKLLAAFTPPASDWAIASLPTRDPELCAANENWSISELGSSEVKSTVQEVLTIVWQKLGAHPGATGQIVMRPRTVRALIPRAVSEVPEGWIPAETEETRWIVEVLGTVTHVFATQEEVLHADGDYYMTGWLALVGDSPPAFQGAVSMP